MLIWPWLHTIVSQLALPAWLLMDDLGCEQGVVVYLPVVVHSSGLVKVILLTYSVSCPLES